MVMMVGWSCCLQHLLGKVAIHQLLLVLLRHLGSTINFPCSTGQNLRLPLLFAGHHHRVMLSDRGILGILKEETFLELCELSVHQKLRKGNPSTTNLNLQNL